LLPQLVKMRFACSLAKALHVLFDPAVHSRAEQPHAVLLTEQRPAILMLTFNSGGERNSDDSLTRHCSLFGFACKLLFAMHMACGTQPRNGSATSCVEFVLKEVVAAASCSQTPATHARFVTAATEGCSCMHAAVPHCRAGTSRCDIARHA
jgi:hypothetical protein